ncbi:MAG: hypothetical protein AAFO77_09900, partial [Pseudomonadota bacterium]
MKIGVVAAAGTLFWLSIAAAQESPSATVERQSNADVSQSRSNDLQHLRQKLEAEAPQLLDANRLRAVPLPSLRVEPNAPTNRLRLPPRLAPLQQAPAIKVETPTTKRLLVERAIQRQFETKPLADFNRGLQLKAADATGGSNRIATVLTFQDVLSSAQIARLREQGVVLDGYLGGGSYSASFARSSRRTVQLIVRQLGLNADDVDGVIVDRRGKLKPTIRIAERLRNTEEKRSVEIPLPGNPRITIRPRPISPEEVQAADRSTFLVRISARENWQTMTERLRERGANTVRRVGASTFEIVGDLNTVEEIAGIDSVKLIDIGPPKLLPLIDRARRVIGTDLLQTVEPDTANDPFDGLTGRGARVAILDTGIDQRHDDFGHLGSGGQGNRFFLTHSSRDTHGTQVAG